MALQIVLHTFRIIFGNFGQALRVSVGPYLILFSMGVGLALAVEFPIFVGDRIINDALFPSEAWILLPVILLPLFLFVVAWVAVSWHRFILLEEYASVLPAVRGRPIWSYAGKSILLGIAIAVMAWPVTMIVSGFLARDAQNIFADGATIAAGGRASIPLTFQVRWMIVNTLVTIPFAYIGLRWGIALVGTALGQPLGFFEAWEKSKPIAGVLFGVVVILLAANLAFQLILVAVWGVPILETLVDLAMSWLAMMLGVSILTTLYGHVVEGRPLVD